MSGFVARVLEKTCTGERRECLRTLWSLRAGGCYDWMSNEWLWEQAKRVASVLQAASWSLRPLSARNQITGVASGAVVHLPRLEIALESAARRARGERRPPASAKTTAALLPRLSAHVLCPLSHRGGEASKPALLLAL